MCSSDLPQAPVQDSMPDVDGKNAGGPVLEQAIGETAGGGSNIGAGLALGGKSEGLQGCLELLAAPGYEPRSAFDRDRRRCGHFLGGLQRDLPIEANLPSDDQTLRLAPAFRQPALDQSNVEA